MDNCPNCRSYLRRDRFDKYQLICRGCRSIWARTPGSSQLRLIEQGYAGQRLRLPATRAEAPVVVDEKFTNELSWDEDIRELMGESYFTLSQWQTVYDVAMRPGELSSVPVLPWSTDFLSSPCPFTPGKSIAETHFLFLGLSRLNEGDLTLERWLIEHRSQGDTGMFHNFGGGRFCERRLEYRWYLMPLEGVPGTENHPFKEQRKMLPPEYEVPFAIAETVKLTLACLCLEKRFLADTRVRCADKSSFGSTVAVGRFGKQGLSSYTPHMNDVHPDLQIAASRRLPV